MKSRLTVKHLMNEAALFAASESKHSEPSIYGVTDGKVVGTYLEQKFQSHIRDRYIFHDGNAAKGIDFPELDVAQ